MNAPQRVPSALRMGKAVSPGNGAMPRSSAVVWLSLLALVTLGAWAYRAPLDEVTVGTGKVVPSSREQVVQSLEGGILSELLVHEGDEVVVGQTLARLDGDPDLRADRNPLRRPSADRHLPQSALHHPLAGMAHPSTHRRLAR